MTIRETYTSNGMRKCMMVVTVIAPLIALFTIVVGVAVTRANDTRDIAENTNRIDRAQEEIISLKQVDKEIAMLLTDVRVQMAEVQKELELSRKARENGH